ncbi:hypothetical protein bthur0003_56240 [Bacillus thuringiensis serovar thuringiensis str. T01001]|nr:hypothetical protein H175_328p086 [Bacillus thuringiensis serovar thuringiensis str. IS5056]EEM31871.1 hypothetical protein bthur0003_56240 [Bacillus thuringiensis serovar thuringiensis str. T01001]EEM62904.1 hypothetical protein bthur0008_54860 [Bacillus thuringiensis serovar berliner ATCC 10792]
MKVKLIITVVFSYESFTIKNQIIVHKKEKRAHQLNEDA